MTFVDQSSRSTQLTRASTVPTPPRAGNSARGAALLGGRQVLTFAMSAVAAVVLARWLTPRDYGLFATLNLLVLGAGTILGDLGLTVALVRQADEPPDDDWRAARRLTLAMSVAAAVLGLAVAGLLVFRSGSVAVWVAVLAVALAARFARTVPSARLQRDRRFTALAVIEACESVLYFVTVVVLAVSGAGVASLVLALGAKEVAGLVALRGATRGRLPRGRPERDSCRRLVGVGLPVQASGVLVALTDMFQPAFIGAVLGLTALGHVSWAYNLVLMPILLLGAIDRVVLPSLATVQEDRTLLGLLTARAIRLNVLIAFPMVLALVAVPDLVVGVVFSDRWLPATELLVMFAPAIVTTAMTVPLLHAFNAIGRTRVAMWLSAGWLTATWTVGATVTHLWGVDGFGWFYVVLQLSYVPVWRLAKSSLGVRVVSETRDALLGLCLGVATSAACAHLVGGDGIGTLVVAVLAGELVFAGTIWFVDHARTQADVRFLTTSILGTTPRQTDEVGAGARWRLPYVPALDGLRGLAVLAVMGYHANVPLIGGGFIGVDVFFVLSGFLITALLVAEYERTGEVALRSFLGRRVRRLVPAATVMFVIVVPVLLLWPEGPLRTDSLAAVPYAATYVADYYATVVDHGLGVFAHTWSLAIEEQFYLVWPPTLVVLLRRFGRRAVGLIVGLLVSSVVVVRAVVWFSSHDVELVYFPLHTRADGLLLGALAALAVTAQPATTVLSVAHRHRRSGFVALVVLATGVVGFSVTAPHTYVVGLFVVAVASTVLVVQLAADRESLLGTILSARALVALGSVSYGLYLWHFPVFELVKDALPGLAFRYLVAIQFSVSIALAFASHRVVERRFLAVRAADSLVGDPERDALVPR